MAYKPRSPYEETFNIKPIGVRYRCELCGKGEQVADTNGAITLNNPPLYKHRCTVCGGEMMLPRVYPYIEWIPDEEGADNNESA